MHVTPAAHSCSQTFSWDNLQHVWCGSKLCWVQLATWKNKPYGNELDMVPSNPLFKSRWIYLNGVRLWIAHLFRISSYTFLFYYLVTLHYKSDSSHLCIKHLRCADIALQSNACVLSTVLHSFFKLSRCKGGKMHFCKALIFLLYWTIMKCNWMRWKTNHTWT